MAWKPVNYEHFNCSFKLFKSDLISSENSLLEMSTLDFYRVLGSSRFYIWQRAFKCLMCGTSEKFWGCSNIKDSTEENKNENSSFIAAFIRSHDAETNWLEVLIFFFKLSQLIYIWANWLWILLGNEPSQFYLVLWLYYFLLNIVKCALLFDLWNRWKMLGLLIDLYFFSFLTWKRWGLQGTKRCKRSIMQHVERESR